MASPLSACTLADLVDAGRMPGGLVTSVDAVDV